jgi:ATP-dependent helicase/nuclease subunit A
VHALFERAARLFEEGATESDLRALLPSFRTQAAALARNDALPSAEAESCARRATEALEKALADPHGLWILKPHPEAQTESSWTGMINGVPRTLRIDRSFRAGPGPLSEGADCLWIIDYKTATHGESGLAAFLEAEKLQYAEQLESYGRMMRLAHGSDFRLRLGLYYPLLRELLWWPA